MSPLLKRNISLFLFLFINFIFCIKYSARITNWYLPVSVIYTLILFAIWYMRPIITKIPKVHIASPLLLTLFFGSCFLIWNQIPVETLNVDRWSVITSFWDTSLSGEYAYFAQAHTGNPPGPMPYYFLLAFPFYLLGELGIYSFLGLLLFFLLLKFSRRQPENIFSLLILTAFSTFFLWEIVSRSNIFTNGVLVCCSIWYFNNRKNSSLKHLIFSGILAGLFLSTRNVFIIPYIIAFLYAWRSKKLNLKEIFIIGTVMLSVFVLTFVPFVTGHWEEFKIMNPFLVQSTFLIPFEYTIAFVLLAFLFGFVCKNEKDVYFLSGVNLFIAIAVYFIYHFVTGGFTETFFESLGDVSYFILGIPFLLYYLSYFDQTTNIPEKVQS